MQTQNSKVKSQNYSVKLKTFTLCALTLHFALCTLNLGTRTVRAQNLSLGLWPPIHEAMMMPGKSIIISYRVYNYGDPLILTSKIVSFSPIDEKGNVKIEDKPSLLPISFNFENVNLALGQSFFLGSQEEQEIVFRIAVPQNTLEGDYYFSLVFSSLPPEPYLPQQTGTQAEIASHILLTISKDGKIKKGGSIVEFSAPPIVDSFSEIPITLRFKNKGNSFSKTSGEITLKDILGMEAKYPLLPLNILAGTTRLLEASSSSKTNNKTLVLKGFFFGPYQLEAKIEPQTIIDEKSDLFYRKNIRFFAFPFKILVGFILAFIFLKLITRKQR